MKHLVLDIETMDNAPTAAVLAIGARMIDGYTLKKGFEMFISPAHACQYGTVSDETMAWWNKQRSKDEVFNGQLHPADVAVKFNEFVQEHKPDTVWANSPSFDCVILRHMFKQVGVKWPFHYRDERDCRTLFALQRELGIDCSDIWGNPDRRAHVPLDDATTQAEVVARVLEYLLSNQAVPGGPGSVPLLLAHELSPEPVVSTAAGTGQ